MPLLIQKGDKGELEEERLELSLERWIWTGKEARTERELHEQHSRAEQLDRVLQALGQGGCRLAGLGWVRWEIRGQVEDGARQGDLRILGVWTFLKRKRCPGSFKQDNDWGKPMF